MNRGRLTKRGQTGREWGVKKTKTIRGRVELRERERAIKSSNRERKGERD